jgi:hypothetical protein
MADPRLFELDELLNRPGTYFNPHTEVLLVVDDSPEMDPEIFNRPGFEGAEWVLVSDETPIDDHQRDELVEAFQVSYQEDTAGHDGDDEEDELDELEPDEDPEPE